MSKVIDTLKRPFTSARDVLAARRAAHVGRAWDSVTGSVTPRAIQSVSASTSNVNAQAASVSRGQAG